MEELKSIMESFSASGWDLISVPAQQWLDGNADKELLVSAIKQANEVCGNCGCELDPLYKRALELISQLKLTESDENVDWNDDSGVIHSIKNYYNITKEDGWQDNQALSNTNSFRNEKRKIYGKQVGFQYITDDYRKVIPGYIFGTIFVILVCIIVTIIFPVIGIFIDIFGAIWIIGFWMKAPFTKWKNQSEKLKEGKSKKN